MYHMFIHHVSEQADIGFLRKSQSLSKQKLSIFLALSQNIHVTLLASETHARQKHAK